MNKRDDDYMITDSFSINIFILPFQGLFLLICIMLKTLTHHYHKLSFFKRTLLGILFSLGIFVIMFRFLYAINIPFSSQIENIFTGWLDTGYYSNTHFKYGGNDFVGIIFRQSGITLSPPQHITINSGTMDEKIISCSEQLRGIYYNNQRGWIVWPLDTGNLALLTGAGATGYDNLIITGGWYSNCTGYSGGYIPAPNEVYGQIDHLPLIGQKFSMFAGLEYDFSNNSIIPGTSFSGTLKILTGGIHDGHMFDNHGGIAELNMNLPWCGSFDVFPTSIAEGTTTLFMCEGNSVYGYKLDIFSGGNNIYHDIAFHTGNSQLRTTGSSLLPGNYTATCTILLSGGLGGPQCGLNTPFTVTGTGFIPGTGCNPNFQGEISFASLYGSMVTNPSIGTYYTNQTGIVLQRAATEPTHVTISGDFVDSPLTGNYTGTNIFDHLGIYNTTLLYTNTGRNYFYSIFTTGSCTYIDAIKRVFVDTIPPTAPDILIPNSGAYICPSIPFPVQRTPSYDSGAGISHYAYAIYTNSGMNTGLVLSGTIPGTTTGTHLNISLLPIGTYYMQITAVDNVGLTEGSTPVHFTTSQSYCPVGTGILIVTPEISITNADLDTVYRSQPIYIMGLTGPSLLTISHGMLFVNNGTGIGTTGIVTSNDTIYIELVSSNAYDTTITSTLSIMGVTGTFSVTTKNINCVLSAGEKLIIQNIYQNLKTQYNNNIHKLAEFLNTFQSMVTDEFELSNSCTLEYLLRLIEEDLGYQGGIDTSNHICPNCKEYNIAYDISQLAYYSPDMMNRYYFVNRESLIRHLDYYNPGDCHINTYGTNYWIQDTNNIMKHIAPNGKIYHIVGEYGSFSAEEFIKPKYFDSLQGIKYHIDMNNPAKTIWKHTIDTSFFPIVYAAPNGKEYKIYKTDRGYMSYKLMKVQYFSSLGELKGHIDKNNPSRR